MSKDTHGFWGNTSEEILKNKYPLHKACRDGDVETLSMLLVEAQHGIYTEDSFYGWTPAHWAAYFGKLACLRKLMTNTRIGVDCNLKTSRFNQTPAHLSAFGGHPHCLQWLLQSDAETDGQDYLGETPIHKAARSGSMECVSLLASHGAKLFIKSKAGESAAQLASKFGHAECSQYLENAASHQETSLPLGIYHAPPAATNGIDTKLSSHDVTASKVFPCVINYGINGGRLPPAPTPTDHGDIIHPTIECDGPFTGHATLPLEYAHMNGSGDASEHSDLREMIAMEQEEFDQQTGDAAAAAPPTLGFRFSNGDVTLHKGISANHVPVAGKKRSREDCEEMEHKRMRKNDAAQWDADIHDNHSPSLTSYRGFETGKAWQKHTGNAIDQLNARSCTSDAHLYECVMRTMSGDDAAAVVCGGEVGWSDSAVEHCSSVLQEMGYGDMVSASLCDATHFHGN